MSNLFSCIGRLTRDPEKRDTKGGQVVNFTVADDYAKDKTAFHDCTMWGDNGNRFAEWMKKGYKVHINGRINQEDWDDKDSGSRRSKKTVTVYGFENLQPRDSADPATKGDVGSDIPF